MECYCYLRNVQDLLADGKTPHERRFGEPFQGPVIHFGVMVEYFPISAKKKKTSQGSTNFCKKVLPGIFLGYAVIAGGIWKWDILVADIEGLENIDASEIHPRRINAKEVLTPQRREKFVFPAADGTAKLSVRDHEFREPTQRREQPVGSEALSGELQGEQEGPQPTETKDDAEAQRDFWSIEGDSSIVSTLNLEFKSVLCAKRKNPYSTEKTLTWPDQLTQIWMWCEKRVSTTVGELCQIRGQDSRNSRNWVRNLLQGMCGLVGAWQRSKQLPEYVWPEIWIGMSKAARKARLGCREAKARQCWKIERDKLHRSGRRRASGNHRKKRKKETRNSYGSGYALQDGDKRAF